jgi:hypothetical protein
MKRIFRGRPLPPEEASQYKAVRSQLVGGLMETAEERQTEVAEFESERQDANETARSIVQSLSPH